MDPRSFTRSTGSAVADVERAIAGLLIALRACILVTIAVAAPDAVRDARLPACYIATTVAMVAFCAAMFTHWLRVERSDSVRWGIADVAVGAVALPLVSASLPVADQLGTWSVWGPGYLLAVAAAVAAWARPWALAAICCALGAWYFVVIGVVSHSWSWSLGSNAVNYPLVALAAAWVAAVLRRFARQADEGREAAAAAAARLESERYRMLVHDTTGILSMLASEDIPPEVGEALRAQALAESARLRSYVDEPRECPGASLLLGDVVRDALCGFRDLPLEPILMLAGQTRLDGEVASALRSALATVLHNTRRHARARQVVVHADSRDGAWELTVRDDGVGFDPARQPLGFGLSTQVFAQSATVGIEVDLQSEPGQGTVVVFRGSAQPAPAPQRERRMPRMRMRP